MLKRSNYDVPLQYSACDNSSSLPSTNRRRHRNIIWFNPPFSKTVRTNVGRNFLQLIDKHFPSTNPLLNKVFKTLYRPPPFASYYDTIFSNKISRRVFTPLLNKSHHCNGGFYLKGWSSHGAIHVLLTIPSTILCSGLIYFMYGCKVNKKVILTK